MKLQPIIAQIKENSKKGIDIENSLYMLMMNTIIYCFSDIDMKYYTSPNKTYKIKCLKFVEAIKRQSFNIELQQIYQKFNLDVYTEEGFEDSENEKLNYFNKETTISQKARKPNQYEDSLIQSLLQSLNEKDEQLKKKYNSRKINPETFREFLESTGPYELWKIIQDLKGGYYFFEVFENQKLDYGINYQYIDKMIMCSKAYEREYEQYKTNLRQQQEIYINALKQELQNKNSYQQKTQITEPICLIIKEDPDIICNCDSKCLRLMFYKWQMINKFCKLYQQQDLKYQFKNIVFNTSQITQQINNQYEQLLKINDILKSKLASIRVLHQQQQQEILNLQKQLKYYDEELQKQKQQYQKLYLEKSQIFTKLINTENSLLKIREFSETNNIANKLKLVQENLEQLEIQNLQAQHLFKLTQISQFTQTDKIFDYQLCNICSGENQLFLNIQQLKIPSIQFEKLDMEYQQILYSDPSKTLINKFTQTEFQLTKSLLKTYEPPSPVIVRKRGTTSYHLNNENSIIHRYNSKSPHKQEQIVKPVFKRLFDDSYNKKLRQNQLTTRIQHEEQNQWEEVLSLLNLLNTDRQSKEMAKKVKMSIDIYKDEQKDKLPKLKEKVPEHLIESLLKQLQGKKKVALQELMDQFQTILTVNKLQQTQYDKQYI